MQTLLVPTMLLRLPACLLAILVLSGGAPRPIHSKRVRAQRKARKAALKIARSKIVPRFYLRVHR